MRIVSLGVVVGVLVTILVGCTDSAAPPPSGIARIGVAKLDAPTTVALGSPVDAVLTVEVGGCVSFDHITAARSGSRITLAAWGKTATLPPNAVCMAYLIQEPHTYRLDPPFPTKFTIVVQPIQFGVLLSRDVQVQ
jgi:hypothetical protein